MVKFVAAKQSDESHCIVMGGFPKVSVFSDNVKSHTTLLGSEAITTFIWGQLGRRSFKKLFETTIGTSVD